MKHSVKDILNKKGQVPEGMSENDRMCLNDFGALTNHKSGADFKLRTRTDDYKKDWNKRGIIQFKNERIAILQRVWGSQVEFIAAFDDLTKEGYRCIAHDEGKAPVQEPALQSQKSLLFDTLCPKCKHDIKVQAKGELLKSTFVIHVI